MKKFSSFRSIVAGVLAISSLTMCKKKEEDTTPDNGGGRASIEAVSSSACSMTIQPNQPIVDGSTVPAGSVVCIPAGTRGALLLKNFKGTAANPIIFINKGGKAVIKNPKTSTYSLKTVGCSNFKILGNGDPSIKYGIDVDGGNISLALDQLSTDFEVANVEVHNSGFAGIMGKTDPSCDKSSWRGNFTLRNVNLHDNYVHHTGGEGFYIGNSFYANGKDLACGKVLPHSIENVRIHNNITDATACEGIQVGCVIKGLEVYNNTITNYGQNPFANAQNNGLQIGEGSGGKCYNNLVKNGPGNGIIVLGLGDNVVYNNCIINAGSSGIFCDERYTPGSFFKFINNTIINPGADGLKLYSDQVAMNTVMNNVIIKPGSGKAITKLNANVKITDVNNYLSNDIATCKFINVNANDFRVSAGSALIDKGANASAHGVSIDFYNTPRPYGGAYDIGAAEYKGGGSGPSTPTPPPTTPTKPTPTPPVGGGSGTITPGTLTVTATEDVYFEGSKVLNYSIIRSTPNQRTAYLKFNVAGLSGAVPKTAKLRLRRDTYGSSGSVNVGLGNNANWTESSITAAKKPAQTMLVGSLSSSYNASQYYEIDVTKAIKADGAVTLIVNSSADVGFSSSEKANPPQLIITK